MSIMNNLQLPTPPSMAEQEGESAPSSRFQHSATWTPIESLTPTTTNPSRKRSRDESAFEHDGEYSYFSHPTGPPQVATPAAIPEDEPLYGEGMVLLNPKTGRPMAAESQTGTWYEDKVVEEEGKRKMEEEYAVELAEVQSRPQMPVGRKSIRLSQSSIRATLEPVRTHESAPSSPPKSSPEGPEVDEATMALGIGWTKLASEDPDLQAAARGWVKYLENHFRSLHKVEILLKSRSLNAYLVACEEGFFLFSDDLLEGKLVGRSWETCLQNLKAHPMAFEGNLVLKAERTPGVEEMTKKDAAPTGSFNPLNNHLQQVTVDGSSGMDLD